MPNDPKTDQTVTPVFQNGGQGVSGAFARRPGRPRKAEREHNASA